jgi:hypothetical protein
MLYNITVYTWCREDYTLGELVPHHSRAELFKEIRNMIIPFSRATSSRA